MNNSLLIVWTQVVVIVLTCLPTLAPLPYLNSGLFLLSPCLYLIAHLPLFFSAPFPLNSKNVPSFLILLPFICLLFLIPFGPHLAATLYSISILLSSLLVFLIRPRTANNNATFCLAFSFTFFVLLFLLFGELVLSLLDPDSHLLLISGLLNRVYGGYKNVNMSFLGFAHLNSLSSVMLQSQAASNISIALLFISLRVYGLVRALKRSTYYHLFRIICILAIILSSFISFYCLTSTVLYSCIVAFCLIFFLDHLPHIVKYLRVSKSLFKLILYFFLFLILFILTFPSIYSVSLSYLLDSYLSPYFLTYSQLSLHEWLVGIGLNQQLNLSSAEIGFLNYGIHLGLLPLTSIVCSLYLIPLARVQLVVVRLFYLVPLLSSIHYPVAFFSPFIFIVLNYTLFERLIAHSRFSGETNQSLSSL